MRMENACQKMEFLGEFTRYCIDGDELWFYDEISGGLYCLDRKKYTVEMILSPMEIHKENFFFVLKVLKWENEVYLISNNISHEWLVYNVEDRHLRSVNLFSQSYEIGNVVNIGKKIYLIPEKTSHVLAVVEAETLNAKIISTNWYKNDSRNLECWGYSVFEDIIAFPIIGTKEVFWLQKEQIIKLPIQIKRTIFAISLSKDEIWILPCKGNYIFCTDNYGKQIESVKIQTNCQDRAEQFVRIIAVDRYVYLFPKRGGRILILEKRSKKWNAAGEKNAPLYRSLFQKTKKYPYWGYYYDKGKLYTLPLQYRFAEIDAENASIRYKVLKCSTLHMEQQYRTWISWFGEKVGSSSYVEWERNSLKCFLETGFEYTAADNIKCIGKDIWMMKNNL